MSKKSMIDDQSINQEKFLSAINRTMMNKTIHLTEHLFHRGLTRAVVDIGCSIGEYSLYYSQFFNRVYAFDPVPNIKDNDLIDWDRVEYFQFGIGNENISLPFYWFPECPSISSFNRNESVESYRSFIPDGDASYIKQIQKISRLDSLSDLEEIDYIKIDIEANNIQVLEGATNVINEYRPSIQIEPNHNEKIEIINYLVNLDYRLIRDSDYVYDNQTAKLKYMPIDMLFIHRDKLHGG